MFRNKKAKLTKEIFFNIFNKYAGNDFSIKDSGICENHCCGCGADEEMFIKSWKEIEKILKNG